MIKIKPIKRNPAIAQFSKEHHFSLLLVWKIREGLRFGVEPQRISAYSNFFFENYLKDHFKEEEELLFAHLDKSNKLRMIAEEDHIDLKVLINKIKSYPENTFILTEFADKLEKHIRFEERELFNELQNTLDESALNLIAKKMEVIHLNKKEDEWNDSFWMKNKF